MKVTQEHTHSACFRGNPASGPRIQKPSAAGRSIPSGKLEQNLCLAFSCWIWRPAEQGAGHLGKEGHIFTPPIQLPQAEGQLGRETSLYIPKGLCDHQSVTFSQNIRLHQIYASMELEKPESQQRSRNRDGNRARSPDRSSSIPPL